MPFDLEVQWVHKTHRFLLKPNKDKIVDKFFPFVQKVGILSVMYVDYFLNASHLVLSASCC